MIEGEIVLFIILLLIYDIEGKPQYYMFITYITCNQWFLFLALFCENSLYLVLAMFRLQMHLSAVYCFVFTRVEVISAKCLHALM